jgi:hypothetical protein
VNFSDSWTEEPTRGEGYEPALTSEFIEGSRTGRLMFAVMQVRGLAQSLREGGNPAVVAEALEHIAAEALGHDCK